MTSRCIERVVEYKSSMYFVRSRRVQIVSVFRGNGWHSSTVVFVCSLLTELAVHFSTRVFGVHFRSTLLARKKLDLAFSIGAFSIWRLGQYLAFSRWIGRGVLRRGFLRSGRVQAYSIDEGQESTSRRCIEALRWSTSRRCIVVPGRVLIQSQNVQVGKIDVPERRTILSVGHGGVASAISSRWRRRFLAAELYLINFCSRYATKTKRS